MKIKTILCSRNNGLFYISSKIWNNPQMGLQSKPEDFLCLGSYGWYPDKSKKELFEFLMNKYDFKKWHDGEYMEMDMDYE